MAGVLLAELGFDVAELVVGPVGSTPQEELLARSKWSVAVPPGQDGRALLTELVRSADAVICDLPDERREQLGLDGASLRAASSAVVVADITPYGRAGEFRALGSDSQVAAALAAQVGEQWTHREGGAYSLPDFGMHMAGVQTAAGVVAALYARAADGATRTVRTSLLAGWLSVRNVHAVTGQGVSGVSVRDPQGGMTPVMRLYRTGDGGWLIVSCSTDQFWGKLCIAIGRPELTADPRFDQAPFGIPPEHKRALLEILETAFASKPRDEWIERLRSCDVPCAPVQSPDEALRDSQLEANRGVIDVDTDAHGPTRQLAPLIRFDDVPDLGFRFPRRAPGADTDDVRERWGAAPHPDAPAGSSSVLPFAGVRVLEICDWVAGPACGNTLRQLGAEVWKIENVHGDAAQALQYVYLPMNAAKSVLRVDLRRPEGNEILARLLGAADVLVHNHRPRRARELGFDAAAAHARNPQIVHHQIHSYGPEGPLAGDPAFDQLMAARTGLAWLQGGMSAGNPPVLHNCSVGDLPAAHLAVLAVGAGLLRRRTTGRGTSSWTSLLESGYLLNWSESIAYDGRTPQHEGGVDFLGPNPARRIYRARDGWVLLAVDDPAAWARCSSLLDLDLGTYDDATASTVESPLARRVEERISGRTCADWESSALAGEVPLVALRHDSTVCTEPHVRANGYDARAVGVDGREFSCPGHLIQVEGQAREDVLAPPDPLSGAVSILTALGYDGDAVAQLATRGVVVAPIEPSGVVE
jgi:crotonobetainyl-CoA:carnitine CoA-transferase CaiB-like acyl-CoA transferase